MSRSRQKSWIDARAVLERNSGEHLILRPSSDASEPHWEFPGGALKANESPESALRRACEALLGVGVDIRVGQPPFVFHYGSHAVTYRYYFGSCVGAPAALGCREIRWVLAGQMRDYVFEPASQQVVDWLLESPRKS